MSQLIVKAAQGALDGARMVVLNEGIDYAQFQEFHEVVSLKEKAACV
jgi:hypothetical protein